MLLTSGFTSKTAVHNDLARFSAHILGKPYRKADLARRIRLVLDEVQEHGKNSSEVLNVKNMLFGRVIPVVDDEEDVRDLFDLKLTKLGCKTIHARNGDQAITLYRQALESGKVIDVVILGLALPGGMDGKGIADKIRIMDPQAILVVASGDTMGS